MSGVVIALSAFASTAGASALRRWGTYYGGPGDDFDHDVVFDAFDRSVVVGETDSSSGIATDDAHQTSLGGGIDAFVAQFDDFGALVWGTYYGGSGVDTFAGVTVNGNDDIFAVGVTASSGGIHTTGAHQTSLGGGIDGMLVKFDSNGALLWGTYLGGTGDDWASDVCLSSSGSIYVVGSTASTGLATFGAHQMSRAGVRDGFIAKFSSGGSLLWFTYLGGTGPGGAGTGTTSALACAIDSAGDILVVGDTTVNNGISASALHDSSYNGGRDGYVVKFDASGTRLWGNYYGGSDDEIAYAVDVDSSDNVYIAGLTESTNFIATGGAHSTSLSGVMDAFVARLDSFGDRDWGTYYGATAPPGEVHLDRFTGLKVSAGQVYLNGDTSSSSGIAATGAFDGTYGTQNDAMFVALDATNSARIDGSYNGGSNNDLSEGITVDYNRASIVGHTKSTSGIATSGTHDTSHNGNFDVFVTFLDLFPA